MNEQQLTKAIIQLLSACNWYVIRTHRPGQFATQPGVSDLVAVSPQREVKSYKGKSHYVTGNIAFIEVKGPRTKLKPEQLHFLEDMRSRGHLAFVASDVETVISELQLPVLT